MSTSYWAEKVKDWKMVVDERRHQEPFWRVGYGMENGNLQVTEYASEDLLQNSTTIGEV